MQIRMIGERLVSLTAEYKRRLVQDPGWRQSIAQNGKHTIHTEYSPHVVGHKVKTGYRSWDFYNLYGEVIV